jgi:hypothetical protein
MTKRYWFAGTAILALVASGAIAQTTIETTRQTTVAPVTVIPPVTVAPSVNSYSQTTTERKLDGYGTQTETKQSYSSDGVGTTSRSETQVKRPDGSTESAYREQWSGSGAVVPLPQANSLVTTTVVPAPVPVYPPVGTTTTTTTIRR